MDMISTPEQRADARLGDIANRSEKGSALRLIRAEAEATSNKTARLRALRMEREAQAEAERAAAPPKAPARKSRARKAAVAN